MSAFESCFGARLEAYVALRRGLGFSFSSQAALLRAFDQYVQAREYRGPLTQALAAAFATTTAAVEVSARRYEVVRHFAEYLAAFEPATPVFDRRILRRKRVQPPATILSDAQLITLLEAARGLSPGHPLRGLTIYTVVGLAASTGMRRREVSQLDRADVDLKTGVLVVRQTKFHKDRLVPVHPTTLGVLQEYATRRDAWWPDCECRAFFLNGAGRRLLPGGIDYAFSALTRHAGLRKTGARGPTFHSLRHSFAINRLASWYRAGRDVQALLPVLATYMGHVHYSSTAYYLTATPELMALAAGRCQSSPPDEVRP
jgi:integrase